MLARRSAPSVRPHRRGSTLAVVAVLLVLLVGMTAFAVDIGFIAAKRTDLQRTVDAATLAGAGKLAARPGQLADTESVRAEVRTFVNLNEPLDVLDDDIVIGRYNPAASGSTFTTDLGTQQANAVKVTLRRDGRANGPLNLFFAPVIGRRSADVRAQAVATVQGAYGLLPGAELIPYAVQVDYFYSAIGPLRAGVDSATITDLYTVGEGRVPLSGGDGVKEIVLFGGQQNAPGNFGTVDVGSKSNGTPDLVRQLLSGASAEDFAHKDFKGKVTGGTLYAPNSFTGDTGISAGVENAFTSIIGQKRIVPLYSQVTGTGNNAVYTITEFASVTIVAVDLHGSPKSVVVQPTAMFSAHVSASLPPSGTAPGMSGVYAPPRVFIP